MLAAVVHVQARKLLGTPWALNGDRISPEELGLDPETGWDVSYEQVGSGSEPERELFNQLLCSLSAAFIDEMRSGIGVYDAEIDYPQYARVIDSTGRKMVALAATGPASGNATDPVTPGQEVWREF